MVVQRRLIITESERNRILGMYNRPQIDESVVITDWLSPDEKYVIFMDDLIDVENKTKIGNIWENFEHFKFFIKHSFEVADHVSQEIKESVLSTINSLLITESNQNFEGLKPHIKELLKENIFSDAWDWAKEQGQSAVKGVTDFAKTSYDGLKKAYGYISDGLWSKAIALFKKGLLYVARKIRSAMYTPIGILLETILIVATEGLAKIPSIAVWGIIVALDIYEFSTGNYEEPDLAMGWRIFFFGIDILGLVIAGAAAKAPKVLVQSLIKKFGNGSKGVMAAIKNNKTLRGIAQKILDNVKKVKGPFAKAVKWLKKNAPKLYNFFSTIINSLGKLINMIVKTLTRILGGVGTFAKGTAKVAGAPGRAVSKGLGGGKLGATGQAVVNVGTPLAAIGTYQKGKEKERMDNFYNALKNSDVKADYSGLDL